MTMAKRRSFAGSRVGPRLGLALGLVAFLGWSAPALAGIASPRDDIKSAYIDAAQQLNDLDLEGALGTLDAAIAHAQSAGLSGDPSLAPLHVMRGGILFSTTGDRAQTLTALENAVRTDYNVQLPIELRSDELQQLLSEARAKVQRPSNDPVVHSPPQAVAGEDVEFGALMNNPLPDGATVVLYWRKVGEEGEYASTFMDLFGNFATATVSAAEHGNADIEYFIYAFDENQQAIANRGDRTAPMILEFAAGAGADVGGDDGTEGTGDTKKEDEPKKKEPVSGLPRVFINLGIGTGLGIARGTAEQTYQQYFPATSPYGIRERACAIERWHSPDALAKDSTEFAGHLTMLQTVPGVLPGDNATDLVAAYDPAYCGRRHPVSTGMALAAFHIAPEVGVRVHRAIVVSLFGRLQVVTGSKVFADDPSKDVTQSFNEDVLSFDPAGTQRKPPFSWAIGAKFKYFLGKDSKKFRIFAGGFAGYGNARLRVPMGFSNDRNGNSVPDTVEVGASGPRDVNGNIVPSTCQPVWPYNLGCAATAAGQQHRDLASTVALNSSSSDERIDTVVIGPGFVGALVGFNYQLHKHFALFAELDIGVWFPATSSALFDLSLGPAITF